MLKPYNKKLGGSYAIGVSPTIELLERKPGQVTRVAINPKGTKNSGISKILVKCKELNIPIENNQRLVEKLSRNQNTYAVGVFNKYASKLNINNNHLVLVNPSDMGNLGTILRTMLAFDFSDLAIIKPGVDIFDPKVIRSSMGALFSINIEYFSSFEEYKSKFPHKMYPFMSNGKTELKQVVFKPPYSLVFGNEGQGLSGGFSQLGETVKIPQSSKVDSLNLSIAVGIALHHA